LGTIVTLIHRQSDESGEHQRPADFLHKNGIDTCRVRRLGWFLIEIEFHFQLKARKQRLTFRFHVTAPN
jgi:hypothetical protein